MCFCKSAKVKCVPTKAASDQCPGPSCNPARLADGRRFPTGRRSLGAQKKTNAKSTLTPFQGQEV